MLAVVTLSVQGGGAPDLPLCKSAEVAGGWGIQKQVAGGDQSRARIKRKKGMEAAAQFLEGYDDALRESRTALLAHPLFAAVKTLPQMRGFMDAHVFAVWDFMSLLKTLQRQLTCVTVPWRPPADRLAARFINEIVLGEETDEVEPGVFISHFELYLEAMRDCGAGTKNVEWFLDCLRRGDTLEQALNAADCPAYVRQFVHSTMHFCGKQSHEVAAAFLYGREDIIPEMFQRLLTTAPLHGQAGTEKLRLYLNRHIEIDGESHGPLARKLMKSLCGGDARKWAEAKVTALEALRARHHLWDGVLAAQMGACEVSA